MGESNKFAYDTSAETGQPLTTHEFYDGTQKPWVFKRVWHLEPSLSDPNTVFAGVEDAALFKSTNGGQTWHELAGLRTVQGEKWTPGAGGMGLHTIILDPTNANRIFIAISAAGCFRSDDGGKTWKVITKGLKSKYMPDPTAEVGFCVHRIAQHRLEAEYAVHAAALECHAQRRRRRQLASHQRQSAKRLRLSDRSPYALTRTPFSVVPILEQIRCTIPPDGKHAACIAARPAAPMWEALTNWICRRSKLLCQCSGATRWPWIRWKGAAFILGRRADKFMVRAMAIWIAKHRSKWRFAGGGVRGSADVRVGLGLRLGLGLGSCAATDD